MTDHAAIPSSTPAGGGTKDGTGAADHDQLYAGVRRSQFTTRQMVRLLLLKSDVLDSRLGLGPYVDDVKLDNNFLS